VISKNKALSFDIPALAVRRNDNLVTLHRILTMTSAKRTALGITANLACGTKRKS
jgi:hypothetical protein